MGTMLNYQRDPMSTLESSLVTPILKVAHLITSAAVELYGNIRGLSLGEVEGSCFP